MFLRTWGVDEYGNAPLSKDSKNTAFNIAISKKNASPQHDIFFVTAKDQKRALVAFFEQPDIKYVPSSASENQNGEQPK